MGKFLPGPDACRNTAGRPASAASIAGRILKAIGPEVDDLIARSLLEARAGDPVAISACAILLAAALQQVTAKRATTA